jgi:uncharacterized membrane protein YphA (DoxX/SURF4 family)
MFGILADAAGFVLSLYVGYQFLLAGEKKLAGDPMIVGGFQMVGNFFTSDGDILRRIIGFVEICGAALLVFPSTRGFGVFFLVGVMGGAIYTHLRIFQDEGGWKTPTKLLGLLVVLAFL